MTTASTHSVESRPNPSGGPLNSLLRMAAGDQLLAVSIEDVREILQVARLTPLPRTPGFVRGVMNLRGAVVPVIDLSARLGLPRVETGRRSCIVVVECAAQDQEERTAAASQAMGLLVDSVSEVFDRGDGEIERAPDLGTRIAPQFLRGITRAHGELVGVLALDQVLCTRELAEAIERWQPH